MLKNLFKRGAPGGWQPDVDAVNASEGALLVATNILADEVNISALRRGSSTLYSDLLGSVQATGVHSLYSTTIPVPDPDGSRYDLAFSGEKLYINGVDKGIVMDGSGDVASGDDAYQIFFARGKTKLKWNGESVYNWSIPAPSSAATLAAGTAIRTVYFTFAAGETGGTVTTHEGTSTFAAGYDGSANAATELTPDLSSGRFSISKTFSADTDLFNVQETAGGPTDLIDQYVWMSEPTRVNKLTIMIGLGTGADPYQDDYFYKDFNVNGGQVVDIKDPAAYGVAAYSTAVNLSQSVLTPEDVTNVKTPEQVKQVLARLGKAAGSSSAARPDAQQNSPAWTHFTCPRGQFTRVGNTAGRDWDTVRGIKIVVTEVPGSTNVIRLDDFSVIGGGDRVLTGTFRCVWRAVHNTGNYVELSPPSPVSDPITLNQQPVTATFPPVALSSLDPQVNELWVYLFGGFLDTYYRFEVIPSAQTTSPVTLDEFSNRIDGNMDADEERRGMALELGWPGFNPTTGVTLVIRKAELDAIIENETLEPGAVGVPDNIIAIAGPWHNRLFLVTDEGWVYPTSQTSPSNCSVYQVLDLRRYGDPLWAVRTNGGIYVGLTKDIVHIGGSGDESADHTEVDLVPEPLNVGQPPVDRAVFTDGSTVIYRSADGLIVLQGVSPTPVTVGPTSLLWRGYTRHNQEPLNVSTGRFRIAIDNQILFMLAPEGTDTNPSAVWRYNANKEWRRTTYPNVPLSLFRSNDGRLLMGTQDGKVLLLETGTDDSGATIGWQIVMPWADNGDPLTRKVPFDLQLLGYTGQQPITLDVYLDGSTAPAASYRVALPALDTYRINLSDLPKFFRAQLQLSGSNRSFQLHALNLTYRPLTQMLMAADTGYIIPPGDSDFLWLQELEIDCISSSDLEVEVFLDDTSYAVLPVSVTATGKRKVYIVPMPRGTKSDRVRAMIRTTAADGSGAVGFECFRIRGRQVGSGNMFEIPFQTTAPGGTE